MSQPDVDVTVQPSGTGCVDCDATGGWWFHLRRCAACGHIGCCDSSLSKHATAHATSSGHPVITSFEPGEDWFFDYRTERMTDGPALAAPDCHPVDQSTPGPASRVPADWEAQLEARHHIRAAASSFPSAPGASTSHSTVPESGIDRRTTR